jgi:hypothetical protein
MAAGGRWLVSFTEVDSGKRNDRTWLVKALVACKKQLSAKQERIGAARLLEGILGDQGQRH